MRTNGLREWPWVVLGGVLAFVAIGCDGDLEVLPDIDDGSGAQTAPIEPDPGPPVVPDEPPPGQRDPGSAKKGAPAVANPSPARPPAKPLTMTNEEGRLLAKVAAGTSLDADLNRELVAAGALHAIDVTATDAALLRVVPLIRQFPKAIVVFAAGEWTPGVIAFNETATADDLKAATTMNEVRGLDLSMTRLVDAELAVLGGMVWLESLRLPATVTNAGLVPLGRIVSLRELSLEHSEVTGDGLATLPLRLASLNLADTTIDDEAVEQLARYTMLRELWLDETEITDGGLLSLARHGELGVLSLTGTAVSAKGLKHLAGLVKLNRLYLAATGIDDTAVPILTGMSQLRELDVTDTALGIAARETLKREMRNCQVLVDVDPLVEALADNGGQLNQALAAVGRVTLATNGQVMALNISQQDFGDQGMAVLGRLTSLKRLSLVGTAVTDAGLAHLSPMTQLQELWLSDTGIGDSGLAALRPLRALEQLHLDGTRVTVSGVLMLWPSLARVRMTFNGGSLAPAALFLDRDAGPLQLIPVENVSGLRHLELNGLRIGDEGLEKLEGLVEIKALRIRRAGLHGPGLAKLKNMGSLQLLDLTGNPLDELDANAVAAWVELRELILDHTGLKSLAPFATTGREALKRLSLVGTAVDDEQLAGLAILKGLELLDLSGCPVTDTGVTTHLPKLAGLQALGLRGTAVTGAALQRLTTLSTLRVLRLSDTATTAEGLAALRVLPQLNHLDLAGCPLDDASLKVLSGWKLLGRLDLSRTTLTAASVTGWRKRNQGCQVTFAADPVLALLATATKKKPITIEDAARRFGEVVEQDGRIVELEVTDTSLTDVGVARLMGLEGLVRVGLAGVPLTDAGVGGLEQAATLEALDLSGTAITDNAAGNLSRLAFLTELSLANTRFSDRGLSRLTGLENLQILDLSGLAVSDIGLVAVLPRLKQLRSLNLSRTWIENADLRVLGTLPQLESLSIRDTVINDNVVGMVSQLKSLRRLWVDGTRLTDEGLQKLRKALPGCKVFGS